MDDEPSSEVYRAVMQDNFELVSTWCTAEHINGIEHKVTWRQTFSLGKNHRRRVASKRTKFEGDERVGERRKRSDHVSSTHFGIFYKTKDDGWWAGKDERESANEPIEINHRRDHRVNERRGNVHLSPMLPFIFSGDQFGAELMDGIECEYAGQVGPPECIPIVEHLEKDDRDVLRLSSHAFASFACLFVQRETKRKTNTTLKEENEREFQHTDTIGLFITRLRDPSSDVLERWFRKKKLRQDEEQPRDI